MEDGASNFARGFFTIGKRQIDFLTDTIRKLVDACEMLQGFFLNHSVSGGTGSGFSTLAIDTLTLEYTKRNKFQMGIFPSPLLSTAVVEPYNTVLSSVRSIENTELTTIMDNEAIYGICHASLGVSRPTFSNINRVVSQVFSDLTTSLRFQSSLNSDLDQLCTNLIPYPRIHFPVVSHAPLTSASKAGHEPASTGQLTKSLFDGSSQMVSCALGTGKYMCCVMQYRGRITPKDVNQSIFEIKRKSDIKFVDWCPTGFKLGINTQPPIRVPGSDIAQSDRSVTMLANSTSIKDIWEDIMRKFDILFSKRSFVHWYVGEGMEEGEFNETRDEIGGIYMDYAELEHGDEEEAEGGDEPSQQPQVQAPPPPQAQPPLPQDHKEFESIPDEEDEQAKEPHGAEGAAEKEEEEDEDDEDEESETDN